MKKSIVITGASSGLGAALALNYAKESPRLVLIARDESRLRDIAMQCRDQGAEVEIYVCDVTDRQKLHDILSTCDDQMPLNLIICNAGISGGTGGTDIPRALAQSRRIFDVNVTGVLNTLEPILPRMMMRKSGQVAIVSSMASFIPLPNAPAYGASKTAVRVYTEALRATLKPFNIKVNSICPGFVKTRMTEDNRYPMPFLMEAHEAAKIIVNGLERNKARIIFPLPMKLLVYFLRVIPTNILIHLMKKAPAKNALQGR
jgi:short-subunit dehydrogenase